MLAYSIEQKIIEDNIETQRQIELEKSKKNSKIIKFSDHVNKVNL